jgi:hypothetical protein
MELFTAHAERDDKRIAEIEAAVIAFNAEVDETIAALKAKVGDFMIAQPKKEPTADEMRAALMNDLQEMIP